MNYYIIEDEIITQSAEFKFSENCLETEENIIRGDDGILRLESEWKAYQDTEEYKNAQKARENAIEAEKIKEQITEIDQKRIRALCEPEVKDPESGLTWLEYYNSQIAELREQLNNLI